MDKKNLFDEDSDEEEKLELKTNESYANSYNQFRKKELLSHCKYLRFSGSIQVHRELTRYIISFFSEKQGP